MFTTRLSLLAVLLLAGSTAHADVRRIWAVNDGEKIERDARNHALAARNSAWNGQLVTLSAARNEIVAFQIIVEADSAGVKELSVRLPELTSGRNRIVYRSPASDPTDYVGRPIQIFSVNSMLVTTPSHASWVFRRGSPAAPPDPTGWKPVQLVPENARPDRGGMPISVGPEQNQAIWIEIYVDRSLTAAIYRGVIEIRADGSTRRLPIELEVFDFTLPDENSMHAMLYYSSDQPQLYHGRNMDLAYHRLAHRNRAELVHAHNEKTIEAAWGRFSGHTTGRPPGRTVIRG